MENHELLRGISTAVNFKPEYVAQPSGWIAHIPFAAALVSEMKPKLIVELGTHFGHSYFAFCQSVKEAQFDTGALCYAVDTWQGDAQAGWYGEDVYQSVVAHNNTHYSGFSYLLRSTFDNAVSQFADASIDILHIDGLHTYEACKHDYETWLPKVKKGGVILFHDICVRHDDFGVWKLWEEIKSVFSYILSFSYGNGLGVLINDQKLPENKFLVGLLKPDFQHYIQIFEILGNRTLSEADAERAKTDIHAQLYIASGEEEFAEERSVRHIYTAGKTETMRFENIKQFLHGDTLRLRFDPADRPCQVQINRVTLYSVNKDSQVVCLADFETTRNIANSENAIFINDTPIDLISQGDDPQLYLPSVPITSQDDLVFEVELVATTGGWQEIAQCIKQIADERSVTRKELTDSQEELGKSHALEKKQAGQIAFLEQQSSTMQSAQKELAEKLKDKDNEIEASRRQSEIDKKEIESAWRKKSNDALREAQEARDAEVSALNRQMQDMEAESFRRIAELDNVLQETRKAREAEVSALRKQMQDMEAESSQRIIELNNVLQETQKRKNAEISALRQQIQDMTAKSSQKFAEMNNALMEAQKARDAEVSALHRQMQDMTAESSKRIEGLDKSLKETQEAKNAEVGALHRQMQGMEAELSRRIRELDEKVEQQQKAVLSAEDKAAQLNRLLDEIRGNVGRMRDRLFWKMFAPFRALARCFSPKANREPLDHFCLDIPKIKFFARSENPVQIAGWFVDAKGRPAHSVRIRVGKHIVTCGSVNRPDVVAHFKASGLEVFDERVGFDGIIKTRLGLKYLVLESQRQTGEWVTLYRVLLWMAKARKGAGFRKNQDYEEWIRENEKVNPPMPPPANGPLISVLMPVYNTPEKWLRMAIESVRNQTYVKWDLCIADDASSDLHVRQILEEYKAVDKRIRVVYRKTNGHISASSNSALELCHGEFVALLDHDDELAPSALSEVAHEILAHPDVLLVYSDEDKIDINGNRMLPHFKPDWNPDLLTSQNYITHLTVARLDMLRRIGGFRLGYEGSQDWDLVLRVAEQAGAERIQHIPKVLYHWRMIPGSTALSGDAKDYHSQAAQKALQDHFARKNDRVELSQTVTGHWHVRRSLPISHPLVSLIIPTRDRYKILKCCVESILEKTEYKNFEIIIADNDSSNPATLEYFAQLLKRFPEKLRIVRCPGVFNFSRINNEAVKHARGEIIGLLNNDLEVTHGDWLDEMVSHAVRPEIGCVGARLLYPNGTLQHAGVILGVGGVAGHAFKYFPKEHPGNDQSRPHLVQDVSAVTAACLLVRAEIYRKAGGLDEKNLIVAFNDVDFCLKVQTLGYRNLYTPFATLIHHESVSRGQEDSPEKVKRFQYEIRVMKERWGNLLLHDPAYNPNFTLEHEDFSLAFPPRRYTGKT